MVTVNFKLSDIDRIERDITEPQSLAALLAASVEAKEIELGGYIAVRNGKVLSAGDMVHDGDVIDVFPALSGG